MKILFVVSGAVIISIAACSSADKPPTTADTATPDSTTLAPVTSNGVVAPVESLDTAKPAAPARASKTPVSSPTKSAQKQQRSEPDSSIYPLRDSAIRPKGVIDRNGNVTPIKRDSLK